MLFKKFMICDCCHRIINHNDYFTGHRQDWCYAWRACTTQGEMWLCNGCIRAYNILDRLPTEKERQMDMTSLNKRREQDKKKKNKI